MCWMHDPEPYQVISFPTCEGCGDMIGVQKYDMLKEWGVWAEFVHCRRNAMYCDNCRDEINAYRDIIKEKHEEMMRVNLEGTRYRDSHRNIPVGIHHIAQQKTLGLRCAKEIYGYDVTEEILQGFVYHDDEGHQLRRITEEDIDDTIHCDKCWLPLYKCNALEKTI